MLHYEKTTQLNPTGPVDIHFGLIQEFRSQLERILAAAEQMDGPTSRQFPQHLELIRNNSRLLLLKMNQLKDLATPDINRQPYITRSLPALKSTFPTDSATPAKNACLLTQVRQLVLDNLESQELNTTTLCRRLGVSRTQLYRKMKESTNYTPANYIRSVRLEVAYKLLQEESMNIGEVAYRVGFNDQSYFTRTFVEEFGLRPKDVRSMFTS